MNEIPAILRLADGAVLALCTDGRGLLIAPDGSISSYTGNKEWRPPRATSRSEGETFVAK